ncbi:zona pellucida sperm-binding protein 3d.2 isoform X3 [Astatotilapia calliptera]|uniref:zona pellucida sperm-binding protein 3d.2 isoform X3 n=1 Tax=Astatotilapia calliptera TaxID=8154 RepID=UPI000E41CCFE|nr:zona pellucida sperm-binding protein 3-like isoform X3 [Astatotilapia calliptera]
MRRASSAVTANLPPFRILCCMSLGFPGMLYLPFLLLLPVFASTKAGTAAHRPSEQTAQVMRKVPRRETPTLLPPPYLHLPMFVDSQVPLVDKEYFSPLRGTGVEPLPERVRDVLLPIPPKSTPPSVSDVSVKTTCKRTKMQVQVERSLLGTGEARSQLKLGTCTASKSTRDYLYFEYGLGMCGTKRTIIDNQVVYSNTLRYDPPRPIRRVVPFNLPVSCYFNRYQYTYKIGYIPKVPIRRLFKRVKNGAKFSLTPRNAKWERLSPSGQYVLGKPMYFQAEALPMSHDERLYIHSCYATPEKSHTFTLRFPVVRNFGCMVESKGGRSRFIPYRNDAVRFSVDAFLFKGMMGQQLYMHCIMSVGSSVPTPTAKSCNYDTKARRWAELYGSDTVCSCCDSNCSSAASNETQIISSRPWTIEPKAKAIGSLKRNTISTKTTAAPESVMTEWRWTSQPVVTAALPMDKVEKTVKDLDWPFGGGGVMWTEEEVRGAMSWSQKRRRKC